MPKKNGRPYNHELACVYCGSAVFAKMMCRKHYSASDYRNRTPRNGNARRAGEMVDEGNHKQSIRKGRVEPRACAISGCDRLSDRNDGACPRHYGRAKRWGLTIEGLNGWLAVDACESCGSGKRLVLDHDHGHCLQGCKECIRGILCHRCNIALGWADDSARKLQSLAGYISNRQRFS